MFEKFDLDQALDKNAYDAVIEGLRERLGVLQREFRDRKIPVIILFEGWRVSGISDTINRLTYALDPRGYRVHSTQLPGDEEEAHPLLWRFWVKTPAKEQIVIFDRSWYTDTLRERYSPKKKIGIPPDALQDIISMEEQLADDGVVIIKFFLHIRKNEQKKRLKKLWKTHPELFITNNKVLRNLRDYDDMLPILEGVISQTSNAKAPWTIVEATDRHFTIVKVYKTIIARMEATLKSRNAMAKPAAKKARATGKLPEVHPPILEKIDLTPSLPEEEYNNCLEECEQRLHELQYAIHKKEIPVIILFEGWDAAGKGGAIIRLDRALNPRCSVVEPVAAPTPDEKSHHYLWRFLRNLPKGGNITIFDRTWYGRVLVERVEGFCTDPEWQRAYREINVMEEYLVKSGACLIKFWLQIDQDTQLQRFRERETDVLKKYKITDEDWRNREKWDLYSAAIDEMLAKTSPPAAPWIIVESNDKYFARIKILKTVITALQDAISRTGKKNRKGPGKK